MLTDHLNLVYVRGRVSRSKDFISNMPNEILLMILSLIPLKDAVATVILSKRWISVWCNLIHLRIDGGERLDKIIKIPMLRDPVQSMYIRKVNGVIKNHKGPLVQEFQIRFDLDCRNNRAIDYWLQFVLNKKVQTLELDLMNHVKFRCSNIRSTYLYEFDLVSFTYKGPTIDLRLAHLPKMKELDICLGAEGLQNNIFRQIASCVSYIQVLSLKERLMLNSIPELPNVKKLRLTIGAYNDNCLLRFTYIANACPCLETFMIQRKRKARRYSTPTRPYNNLCLLELMWYYGRMSELELVTRIIENAAALKQIVIDPHCQGRIGNTPVMKLKKNLKIEETARTYAQSQLKSVTPQGVKLVIL
ncbi:unnamed protein product [Lactuca saligna]|uniref:F-box domain-containing protein n=1 Tax=Lactuca saligna TaxID=75948 RepID=A0AA36A3Q7_LACSI|nr:unnamed protein product [Lactuca saligna]